MNRCIFRYIALLLLFLSFFDTTLVLAQRSKKKEKEVQSSSQKQRDLTQAEYYFAEGMKFYMLDNYVKAIDYFKRSLEINPDNAGANYAIADALLKSGNHTQAVSYAEKALKLNENNKYYYQLLAKLYEKDKKYSQATKIYQDLIKKLPDDPESYFNLANIYLYQDKYEEAIKAYERVEKTIGINEDVVRQKQQIYLKLNKINDAINEGKKLVEAFPEDLRYSILLAEIYLTNGRSKEAIPLLEQIVSEGTDQAQARLILAEIYRNNGQTEKADQELFIAFGNPDLESDTKVQILSGYIKALNDDKAKNNALKLADIIIKTHPNDAKAYAVYGDLLSHFQEKEQARNVYAAASRLDNSIFEVWNQMIRLDVDLNQLDSLAKHSDQALELFPNQGIFWFYNGYAYFAKKNYDKAIQSLEESKKLSASNKELITQCNAFLGDCYNALGDYSKSDAAYEAVLASNTTNKEILNHVLNNYSYFLSLRKDKLDYAKKLASKLVESNPDNATYLDTYGWILYMMNDYPQAKKYLEKAAKDSDNGTVLEHYGDVLYKLGETEKALQQWMKAKQAGESSELIDKKIAQKKLYE